MVMVKSPFFWRPQLFFRLSQRSHLAWTDAGSHGFADEGDEGDEGPGVGRQPWVIPLLVPAIFSSKIMRKDAGNSWIIHPIPLFHYGWYHRCSPASEKQFWGMNPYKSQIFWCELQGLTHVFFNNR